MGDSGVATTPLEKKRPATQQISKDDNGLGSEEETLDLESGSFQKADADVLASRRIVKVVKQDSHDTSGPDPSAQTEIPEKKYAKHEAPAEIMKQADAPAEVIEHTVSRDESTEEACKQIVDTQLDEVDDLVKDDHTHKDKDATGGVLDDAWGVAASDKNNIGKPKSDEGLIDKAESMPTLATDPSSHEKKQTEEAASEGSVERRVDDSNGIQLRRKGSFSDLVELESSTQNEDPPPSDQISAGDRSGTGLTSANIPAIVLPSSGTVFSSSTFSFGTAPISFETPTGFASFSSSSWTFGRSGTSTSGKSSESEFSFKVSSGPAFPPVTSGLTSTPTVPNKLQEVDVQTGEENEVLVFAADATLFEFASGSWKERGKGELKINASKDKTSQSRLLMRMKGNYKLLLNANLFPDIKMTSMDKRGVTFACVNCAAEEKGGLTTYALKFKDTVAVKHFQEAIDSHKGSSGVGAETPDTSANIIE